MTLTGSEHRIVPDRHIVIKVQPWGLPFRWTIVGGSYLGARNTRALEVIDRDHCAQLKNLDVRLFTIIEVLRLNFHNLGMGITWCASTIYHTIMQILHNYFIYSRCMSTTTHIFL